MEGWTPAEIAKAFNSILNNVRGEYDIVTFLIVYIVGMITGGWLFWRIKRIKVLRGNTKRE